MGIPQIVNSAEDLEKGPLPEHNQSQEEAQSILPNAYYDDVALKLQHRPWLECLHQFMNPAAEGFAMEPSRRMEDFDIKVIVFTESGEPDPIIKCSTPEEFKRAVNKEKEQTGTLIIVKGLSRAMIEILGTTYKLEPEFFASYLAGTELFRLGRYDSSFIRPPARSPYLLPEYIRKAPFYTVEYRRPYHIEGGNEMVFKLRVTVTNVSRGASIVHPTLPDVFVDEKISVYKKKGSKIGELGPIESATESFIKNPYTVFIFRNNSYRSTPFGYFAFLDRNLDKALNALEDDVKFFVGEASVREGKIVGWVSKFAALFLPVSLLATILSISDPGYVKWAILGGLSVPFVLISIYLMFMFPTYFDSPKY